MEKHLLKKVLCFAATGLILSGGCGLRKEIIPDDHFRTTYEIFVGSFADSNGDGTGDLRGITEHLDYINDGDKETFTDLGCDEIWLTPVFPSPTYHKYDVTDYENIDPSFGTLSDFDELLKACHQRGIRLILDLPVNHTSTEHPWFREHPEYYCFSGEPKDGYAPLSVDGKTVYYEARFWEGMPDLNLDNEDVRSEISRILSFWLDRGVDGFRLDAVTSYYTDEEQKNIAFLTWLNRTAKEEKEDCYLVGEAWTEQGTYSRYYESGIDSFFDFAFANQEGIIASVVRGKKPASFYAEALEKEETLYASFNANYVNAPFYTNHDMGRSAGYYAYDDGSRTKLAGALNLLMTGNVFLYYGEELGMKGSGKDENKRAPMFWYTEEEGKTDPTLRGICSGPPEMDPFDMKFGSLEEQKNDPLSVYQYFRRAVQLRNAFPCIARGKTAVVKELTGEKTCAFTRTDQQNRFSPVEIVINTSEEEEILTLPENGFYTMASSLSVADEKPSLNGRELTLPAFGIAVLTR